MLDWKPRQKQSRLLTLPAEIRNLIYEFTLQESSPLVTYCLSPYESESYTEAIQPSLTHVNRQIRDESLPVFYGCNDFVLHTESAKANDTQHWLICNAPYLQDIKRLSVWLRYCNLANARIPAHGAMSIAIERSSRNDPWNVDEGWRWVTVCKKPAGLDADVAFLMEKLRSMLPVLSDEATGPEQFMGLGMDLRRLYIQKKNS